MNTAIIQLVTKKWEFIVPIDLVACQELERAIGPAFDELDLDYTWDFTVFNWARRVYGPWFVEQGFEWASFWWSNVTLNRSDDTITISFEQMFEDEATLFKLTFGGWA